MEVEGTWLTTQNVILMVLVFLGIVGLWMFNKCVCKDTYYERAEDNKTNAVAQAIQETKQEVTTGNTFSPKELKVDISASCAEYARQMDAAKGDPSVIAEVTAAAKDLATVCENVDAVKLDLTNKEVQFTPSEESTASSAEVVNAIKNVVSTVSEDGPKYVYIEAKDIVYDNDFTDWKAPQTGPCPSNYMVDERTGFCFGRPLSMETFRQMLTSPKLLAQYARHKNSRREGYTSYVRGDETADCPEGKDEQCYSAPIQRNASDFETSAVIAGQYGAGRLEASGICADGSVTDENLNRLCYQPAYGPSEDTRYYDAVLQPMYGEGRLDGIGYCPDGSPVDYDGINPEGTCHSISNELDYDRFLKSLDGARSNLVDRLFPGYGISPKH